MAEVEIPNGTQAPVSADSINGHGPGYDGLRTADGHAPKPGQKPVTIAIVGAGQRGSVSRPMSKSRGCSGRIRLTTDNWGRSTPVTL